MDKGIDYGNGLTSVDFETGIRYGVIPMNSLHEWAWESVEADYGEPHCPKCGNKVSDYSEFPDTEEEYTAYYQSCSDYFCENCKLILGSYMQLGMSQSVIFWMMKSTKARWIVPGTCSLSSPLTTLMLSFVPLVLLGQATC